MTQQEIQDRNKEIAKMLGFYEIIEWFKTDSDAIPYYKGTCYYLGREGNTWSCGSSDKNEVEKHLLDTLRFHSDCNWLHEVVEFIEKSKYDVVTAKNSCGIWTGGKCHVDCKGTTKKEAVFIAVSDFAKKFNNKEL